MNDQRARDGQRRRGQPEPVGLPTTDGAVSVRLYDAGEQVHPEGVSGLNGVLPYLDQHPEHMALVAYTDPGQRQIRELGAALGLHPLLVEDLLKGHQRPKLERYEDTLFMVVEPTFYLDDIEDVDVAEVHVLKRENMIVMLVRPTPHGMVWACLLYTLTLPTTSRV